MFKLHPQLEKDTFLVKDLKLCRILLIKNALYPWFVLVPKKENLTEIMDLNLEQQILLTKEIDFMSRAVKKIFKPHKLNIAALGNVVPQLHIHIIARFKNDVTFPKPVWGDPKFKEYEVGEVEKIISAIEDEVLF
ncbi:MAG: diadenosine tetraphosphate (Ap4A) HIT family hydrolase [Lentimonas sp.]|jgi:diadenosine tetraphosphate (Ap4A) HIT family hydrolase